VGGPYSNGGFVSGAAPRALIIGDSPADAIALRDALQRADGRSRIYQTDTLLAGLDRLAAGDIDLVLFDLAVSDGEGLEGLRALRTYAPAVPVVVLMATDQDSNALRARQGGAEDCLVRGKIDSERIARVLQRLASKPAARGDDEAAKRATVVGLVGSKGGVGTTTVACNLSIELKNLGGGRVLLMDLDMHANVIGFLMKTESKHALLEAANSIMRLDETRWRDLVTHGEGGLDIMPSGGPACREEHMPRVERLGCLLRFIRPQYDWIVIDLGRLTPTTVRLCAELSQVLVVSSLEAAALNGVLGVARGLREAGMQEVRLAVNRTPKVPELSQAEVEKLVGVPVEAMLPECEMQFKEAMSARQLLGHSRQFSSQIAPLARRLAGAAEETNQKKLFGLFRRRA